MSTNAAMIDINDLVVSMGNTELDPQGPTGEYNRLAEQFAAWTMSEQTPAPQNEAVIIPPNITDDERLLLLAGWTDWRLDNSSQSEYPLVELPEEPQEFGEAPPTPLLTFRSVPNERTNAGAWAEIEDTSVLFRDNISSRYSTWLDCKLDELAGAVMPDKEVDGGQELAALCVWMSDELYRRWEEGRRMVVFAPIGHVYYPCWLAVHPINEIILQAKAPTNGA